MLFSEPKIPQIWSCSSTGSANSVFSALQRAENSSNTNVTLSALDPSDFQCSSASRKFLKVAEGEGSFGDFLIFSALQRAENSSNVNVRTTGKSRNVSFQCSSASRKFLKPVRRKRRRNIASFSVLFSEPKIPQSRTGRTGDRR